MHCVIRRAFMYFLQRLLAFSNVLNQLAILERIAKLTSESLKGFGFFRGGGWSLCLSLKEV